MKINGNGNNRTNRTSGTRKAGASSKASSGSNARSSSASSTRVESDQFEMSNHQETLAMIRRMVSDSPDIRVEEVERIVDQLKKGKYKINFEKVAEGFIKEAIVNEMAKKMLAKNG